jgi:hypothetical protein
VRVGQDLVDYYSAGIGDDAAVIISGGATGIGTRTPGIFFVPTAQIVIGRVYYSQREIFAVGKRMPAVFIAEIQNGPADGVQKFDSFAGVVQSA